MLEILVLNLCEVAAAIMRERARTWDHVWIEHRVNGWRLDNSSADAAGATYTALRLAERAVAKAREAVEARR